MRRRPWPSFETILDFSSPAAARSTIFRTKQQSYGIRTGG